jgi:hypothetical protein
MPIDTDIHQTQIQALLTNLDIEGLIALGAPQDEYTSESEIIFTAIRQLPEPGRNPETMLSIVLTVWQESFGLSEAQIRDRLPLLRNLAIQLDHITTSKL